MATYTEDQLLDIISSEYSSKYLVAFPFGTGDLISSISEVISGQFTEQSTEISLARLRSVVNDILNGSDHSHDLKRALSAYYSNIILGVYVAPLFHRTEKVDSDAKKDDERIIDPLHSFYIGSRAIVLPGPDSLQISEEFGIVPIMGLRSDTDAIYRNLRGNMAIQIDAIFKDRDSINSTLRPLLAELRTAPLTVIEGEYLREVLLRELGEETAFEILAKYVQREGDKRDNLDRLLSERGLGDDISKVRFKELLEQGEEFTAFLSELRDAKIESDDQQQPIPTLTDTAVIPVMFMGASLMTIPDLPEAVRVRFTFCYCNDRIFSKNGLRFLDIKGDPTPDIRQCFWLHKLVEQIYLTPGKPNYIPPIRSESSSIEFEYLVPNSTQTFRVLSIPPGPQDRLKTKDDYLIIYADKYDKEDIILSGLTIGFENKTAPMPTNSEAYPAYQYLGRGNGRLELDLICTKRGAKLLHDMKWSTDFNVRSPVKNERGEVITITNPLVNMMGTEDFVIQRVFTSTEPQLPDRVRVTMTLIESKINQRTRENLILGTDFFEKVKARAFWQYLMEVYDKWSVSRTKILKGSEEEIVLRLLFGPKYDGLGIINIDVFKAAIITDDDKSKLAEVLTGDGDNDTSSTAYIRKYLTPHSLLHRRAVETEFSLLSQRELWDLTPAQAAAYFLDVERAKITVLPKYKYPLSGLGSQGATNIPDFIDARGSIDADNFDEYHRLRGSTWLPQKLDKLGSKKSVWADIVYNNMVFGVQTSRFPRPSALIRHLMTRHLKAKMFNMLWSRPSGKQHGSSFETRGLTRAAYLLYRAYTDHAKEFPGFIKTLRELEKTGGALDPKKSGADLSHRTSAYPDMNLITYRELFSSSDSKEIDPVWTKFAPSYARLGLRAPIKAGYFDPIKAQEDVARSPDDLIDPTFFYSVGEYRGALHDIRRELISERLISRVIGKNAIKLNLDLPISGNSLSEATLSRALYKSINGAIPTPGISGDPIEAKGRARDPEPELVGKSQHAAELIKLLKDREITQVYLTLDSENLIVGRVIKDPNVDTGYKIETVRIGKKLVYSNEDIKGIEQYSVERVQRLTDMILESTPEDKLDPRKCFPTFKVRIIDFETGQYHDDFYDYNAIKEIHIVKDKYDADVATIEFLNTTGNLDTDSFLTTEELIELSLPPDDDPRGGVYSKIKIKEGTAVQILMGHSPKPSELQVVFTGRISEIAPGEIFKIVAQGYKTELLNEINFKLAQATPARIVQKIFDKAGDTPHLGERVPFGLNYRDRLAVRDFFGRLLEYDDDLGNRSFGDRLTDRVGRAISVVFGNRGKRASEFVGLLDRPVDKFDNTDRLKNIHYRYTGPSRTILMDITGKGGTNWNYYVLNQTSFDALLEVNRFMPGWVCDVVPKDQYGTVYMGPPEGEYTFTNNKPFEYDKFRRNMRVDRDTVLTDIWGLVKEFSRWSAFVERTYDKKKYEDVDISSGVSNIEWLESVHPKMYNFIVTAYFGLNPINPESNNKVIEETLPDLVREAIDHKDPDDIIERMEKFEAWKSKFGNVVTGFLNRDGSLKKVFRSVELIRLEGTEPVDGSPFEGLVRSTTLIPTLVGVYARYSGGLSAIKTATNSGTPFIEWTKDLLPGFKKFLRIFRLFVESGRWRDEDAVRKILEGSIRLLNRNQDPTKKRFRDYHFIASTYDIISNNIVASTREMANTILLRHPVTAIDVEEIASGETTNEDADKIFMIDHQETSWANFIRDSGIPFYKDLKESEKKLRIIIEKNASSSALSGKVIPGTAEMAHTRASLAFLSNMGEALRPMYRGNLLLWGRNMKPHDILWLNDAYTGMMGTVEVERVIHSFTAQGGWTSMVIPHTHVHVDNDISIFERTMVERVYSYISLGLDGIGYVSLGLAVLGLFTGGGGAVAGSAVKGAEVAIRRSILKAIGSYTKRLVLKQGKKTAAESAKQAAKKIPIMDLAKSLGKTMAGNFKNIQRKAFTYPFLAHAGGSIVDGITNVIAINNIPDVNGVVSFSPLMYQGRPLIAGIEPDDRIFVTPAGEAFRNAAKSIKEIRRKIITLLEDRSETIEDRIPTEVKIFGK